MSPVSFVKDVPGFTLSDGRKVVGRGLQTPPFFVRAVFTVATASQVRATAGGIPSKAGEVKPRAPRPRTPARTMGRHEPLEKVRTQRRPKQSRLHRRSGLSRTCVRRALL